MFAKLRQWWHNHHDYTTLTYKTRVPLIKEHRGKYVSLEGIEKAFAEQLMDMTYDQFCILGDYLDTDTPLPPIDPIKIGRYRVHRLFGLPLETITDDLVTRYLVIDTMKDRGAAHQYLHTVFDPIKPQWCEVCPPKV